MKQDKLHRFSRFELLVGSEGLATLNREKVAVIGLGGVGSYSVEALARAGVGWLILVDYDDICLTNTNRQIHAIKNNYGRPKVEVLEERVKAINPDCIVVSWKEFVTPENLDSILHGRISYVIDAIDTVSSKVALISYCAKNNIPIISAMGTGNKFNPFSFKIDDISKTHTCPLAKAVRKMLRDQGITTGVKVIYSTEKPAALKDEAVATCYSGCICPNKDSAVFTCTQRKQIPGSTSYVPPIVGMMMAGQVIQDLLKISSN